MKQPILAVLFLLIACKSTQDLPQATHYDFPTPVDTQDQPIQTQKKKVFLSTAASLNATNDFDGARLNDFVQVNDSTYRALILPENEPINPSPWYAFKVWSKEAVNTNIILDYQDYRHRYAPKISTDGRIWKLLPTSAITINNDSTEANIKLLITPDTLWVAAQEVINTQAVVTWCHRLAQHTAVSFDTLGTSTLGRPLLELSIGLGSDKKKPVIVIISRQHPPEVTGFMALQGFLERILDQSALSREFLNKYRILVYPLMNPDGVDLGHWRHNAHGVDLNRDWAYYRQPEVRKVADRVVSEITKYQSQVILGLDFHSTYYDIYYTNITDEETSLPSFTKSWLSAIENGLTDYEVNERPSGIGRPVSKSWFFTQFKAVGITYEIGDDTDREFVKHKGHISGASMMQLLLQK